MSMSTLCTLCDNSGSVECDECALIFCSTEHSNLHRNGKTGECFPVKVKECEKVGRYLVTSRFVRAGETLFEEEPVAAGPNQESAAICLICFAKEDISSKCENCGYPVCSECLFLHLREKSWECEILTNVRTTTNEETEINYHFVLPLRILSLKETDPLKYSLLGRLMDHIEDRRRDSAYWRECDENVVTPLIEASNGRFSREDVHRAIGVLEVNAYEIHCSSSNEGFRGIFPFSSLLSHNCTANTSIAYAKETPFAARCIAMVDLPPETEIYSRYVNLMSSNLTRRKKLKDSWYFDCECVRCCDPTECGSFLSAVKCQECNDDQSSYMLARNSLDYYSDWVCRRCGSEKRNVEVLSMVLPIIEKIQHLALTDRYNVDAFLCIHEETSELFHPMNEVISELAKWLIPILCRAPGKGNHHFSKELLMLKEKLALTQVEILDKIAPGINKMRAKYLFEYIDVAAFLIVEKYNGDVISDKELSNQCQRLVKYSEEVLDVLNFYDGDTLSPFEKVVQKEAEDLKRQLIDVLAAL